MQGPTEPYEQPTIYTRSIKIPNSCLYAHADIFVLTDFLRAVIAPHTDISAGARPIKLKELPFPVIVAHFLRWRSEHLSIGIVVPWCLMTLPT